MPPHRNYIFECYLDLHQNPFATKPATFKLGKKFDVIVLVGPRKTSTLHQKYPHALPFGTRGTESTLPKFS